MHLTLNFDGGSRGNPGPAGCGVVLADDSKSPILEAGYFLGRMTNNAAEYTGLLRGLEAALRAGVTKLQIYSDSQLLVRQLNGEYRVKNAGLKDLFDTAFSTLRNISDWKITHIYREANSRADELANMAMDAQKDVVEIDDISIIKSAPKKPPKTAPPAKVFAVICKSAPNPMVCPAPCAERTHYIFDQTVPEGVCIHAARAILNAPREKRAPTEIRCDVENCGAAFKNE